METKEREHILTAINILRKITKRVKLAPFIYAVIFLLCMISYWFADEEVLSRLDVLFYVSPMVCLTFVWFSYPLKLCNWYRLQCCLPMLPQPIIYIDENIYEFGCEMAWVYFATFTFIFLLSLLNAYFVFVRPKRTYV